MSATTLAPITIYYSANPGWKTQFGSAVGTVPVTNDDGAAPTAVSDAPAVATVASPLGGYNSLAHTYVATITAVSAGTANITFSADGQPDIIQPVVVVENPLEGLGTPVW